tara:strand:- start:2217 stop:3053 length:837 start_codon:yes stop_codon:yes gene_type:complete
MPRNNQDRLVGKKKPEDESSPPLSVDALLNFVIPTEFVDLPTKGKFYSVDHPLHNVETIEIRYMTAKETDILSSKQLLKKGVAVDRMLQNLIIDKNIKIEQLFTGDKNAILMAARISGFGQSYEASITCRNCSATSEQSFDLSEVNVKEAPEEANYGENGTFFITLPQTKIEAECRLLTSNDEAKMSAKTEKKRKLKLPESILTDQLKLVIVSLNGITDRSTVEEFVDVMPAQDSNHLRNEYDKMRPDIDLSYQFECEQCESLSDVSIPFSVNFFWPE